LFIWLRSGSFVVKRKNKKQTLNKTILIRGFQGEIPSDLTYFPPTAIKYFCVLKNIIPSVIAGAVRQISFRGISLISLNGVPSWRI
jgi:hypothetical protein